MDSNLKVDSLTDEPMAPLLIPKRHFRNDVSLNKFSGGARSNNQYN